MWRTRFAPRFKGANPAGARCLDMLVSGCSLIVLSPLFAFLAAVIRATSPGPALFRSVRVGQNGRCFTLYKFRTMISGASAAGPGITAADDNRVTPLGSLVRKLKLDELPQFINVLKGEMSVVGPRPEDPRYVALYSREQLLVLEAKPGITSPASIRYRDESAYLTGEDWQEKYVAVIMPAKLAMDRDYLNRRTVLTDLGVILTTIWVVVAQRHRQTGIREEVVSGPDGDT